MSKMSKENDEDLSEVAEEMERLALSSNKKKKELQYPFTWPELSEKFEGFTWILHTENKLSRPDSNNWRVYCFKMLLGCVYVHEKEKEKAIETFASCTKHLEEKVDDSFFKDIMEGLQHIISACTFHMNDKFAKKEVAEDILQSITSFKDLDKINQAAVWAVKAYLLCELGHDGIVEALKYSKLAMSLDPDESGKRRGAWYYLTGKLLFRIRRVSTFEEGPSDEELWLLEKSINKNPFPVHMVLLADAYRETSKCLCKQFYGGNKYKANELCMKSRTLYERAMTQETSISVLKRCGSGLMKLPMKFRNLSMAKEALEKALKIKPNEPHALHGMGNLLAWHTTDYKKAAEYYEQSYEAGFSGAGFQAIKMKYKHNKAYNPLADCNKYIYDQMTHMETKENEEWIAGYLVIKIEFYLLVKEDLLAAARVWEAALDMVPSATHLKNTWLITVERTNCNMHQLVTKSISDALMQRKFSGDEEEYLRKLLVKSKAKETSGQEST